MGCHAEPSQIATPGSEVSPEAVKLPPITGWPSQSVAAHTVPLTPAPAPTQLEPSQNATRGDGIAGSSKEPPTIRRAPEAATVGAYPVVKPGRGVHVEPSQRIGGLYSDPTYRSPA